MSIAESINIQPKRILVITLRYLGDTLLTTPLLSSLKQAYSDAAIDVLTFKTNAAILEGNPDLNQVITLESKPKLLDFAKLLVRLFKQYDLAISTQAGDRPILCAIMAGKLSSGFLSKKIKKNWWKKHLLDEHLIFRENQYNHTILENLRFCEQLKIKPCYRVTPPNTSTQLFTSPTLPYVVLHIKPQWRYKEWHKTGWQQLIEFLSQQDFNIVLTGSGHNKEIEYIQDLQNSFSINITNLAGKLSLAELTQLIGNATWFIGPDTGITHLAAATGTITIAIFGPTDPAKWAPWPFGYEENTTPFSSVGTQHINNVYLVQGKTTANCIPCQSEGCDNHRNSHSACLDNLSAATVIDIIQHNSSVNK